MATWEDGPEYAPLERPAAFTSPDAAPLEEPAPPPPATPGAPVERPAFTDPAEPVAPLATLVPVVVDARDPERPFDVASSTLTSGSAWGSAHGTRPPAPAPLVPAPLVPAAPALPAPDVDALVPAGYPPPPPPPGAFPAPGTPQWFGPGAPVPQPPAPRVDLRSVRRAATDGLLVVLLVGGFLSVLAPLMVAVAFGLRSRVRAAEQAVRWTLGGALGVVIFAALLGLAAGPLDFTEWWGFVGLWSLVTCWITLVTVLLLVVRALRAAQAAPPAGPPNPWR